MSFALTSYPAALSSFTNLYFQLSFLSISVYITPEISLGSSTSLSYKGKTLDLPIFPIKYPSSKITFCLALLFFISFELQFP
jgi:hypothetical protein